MEEARWKKRRAPLDLVMSIGEVRRFFGQPVSEAQIIFSESTSFCAGTVVTSTAPTEATSFGGFVRTVRVGLQVWLVSSHHYYASGNLDSPANQSLERRIQLWQSTSRVAKFGAPFNSGTVRRHGER